MNATNQDPTPAEKRLALVARWREKAAEFRALKEGPPDDEFDGVAEACAVLAETCATQLEAVAT